MFEQAPLNLIKIYFLLSSMILCLLLWVTQQALWIHLLCARLKAQTTWHCTV